MLTVSTRSGDIHQQASPQEAQDELMNLMTIMYIAIQETLNDSVDMSSSYKALRELFDAVWCKSVANRFCVVELNPSLVDFMMTATSKLRWDEQNAMPHTQVIGTYFWHTFYRPDPYIDFSFILEIHLARVWRHARSGKNQGGHEREDRRHGQRNHYRIASGLSCLPTGNHIKVSRVCAPAAGNTPRGRKHVYPTPSTKPNSAKQHPKWYHCDPWAIANRRCLYLEPTSPHCHAGTVSPAFARRRRKGRQEAKLPD